MIQNVLKSMQSLVRWFFGSPFRQLPPEFGETTPPDLRAFEVAAEEARHNARGNVQIVGQIRTREKANAPRKP